MSNITCVSALYGGVTRNKILPLSATSTETELQLGNDFNAASIAVVALPNQNAILGVQSSVDQTVNPAILGGGMSSVKNQPVNNSVFDFNKPFLLRCCGYYTTTASTTTNFNLKLYNGASKAGTAIVTAGPIITSTATIGTSYGFIIEATLYWNSFSQSLRGQAYSDLSLLFTPYAVTTPATVASVSGLMFCCSATSTSGVLVTAAELWQTRHICSAVLPGWTTGIKFGILDSKVPGPALLVPFPRTLLRILATHLVRGTVIQSWCSTVHLMTQPSANRHGGRVVLFKAKSDLLQNLQLRLDNCVR
jgi:hypothetical protein